MGDALLPNSVGPCDCLACRKSHDSGRLRLFACSMLRRSAHRTAHAHRRRILHASNGSSRLGLGRRSPPSPRLPRRPLPGASPKELGSKVSGVRRRYGCANEAAHVLVPCAGAARRRRRGQDPQAKTFRTLDECSASFTEDLGRCLPCRFASGILGRAVQQQITARMVGHSVGAGLASRMDRAKHPALRGREPLIVCHTTLHFVSQLGFEFACLSRKESRRVTRRASRGTLAHSLDMLSPFYELDPARGLDTLRPAESGPSQRTTPIAPMRQDPQGMASFTRDMGEAILVVSIGGSLFSPHRAPRRTRF